MSTTDTMWGEVLTQLGLAPVAAISDGIRFQGETGNTMVEVDYRGGVAPLSVRVRIVPLRSDAHFLLLRAGMLPTPVRWRTGDAVFDDRVCIAAGGREVLPRLGAVERERLLELVGEVGATLGGKETTLEPAVTALLTNTRDALTIVRDLIRLTVRLAVDPPVEELLDRWFNEDIAPSVNAAVARRVVEILPKINEDQAAIACRMLSERNPETALALLTLMPPFPSVLAAWFKVGDPLDVRVVARVVDAWRAGSPRPAARYLAWLLAQPSTGAAATAKRLWETPGLGEDVGFVREFLRSVRRDPPPAALPFLLQVQPKSSALGRRLARALSCYPGVEVDRRLLEWLPASSTGVRQAAASALAERVVTELVAGARADRLEPVRRAAERSSELVSQLVERVPPHYSQWLVPLRPHGEPDAIHLIRRLGHGNAEVDEALLFWLDRGTLPVRLEAANALGNAGSPRVLGPLRDRASAWFSDGGVREACREASERIRRRAGGAGNLAVAANLPGGELSPPVSVAGHLTVARKDEG